MGEVFPCWVLGGFGQLTPPAHPGLSGWQPCPWLYQLVSPAPCPLWGWSEQSLTCSTANGDVQQEVFTHTSCSVPLVSSSRQRVIPDLWPWPQNQILPIWLSIHPHWKILTWIQGYQENQRQMPCWCQDRWSLCSPLIHNAAISHRNQSGWPGMLYLVNSYGCSHSMVSFMCIRKIKLELTDL